MQVRGEVQRAAAAHPGGGRVLLQAAPRLQAGAGQHLPPPNPSIFIIDLQDANKKQI